VDAATYGATFLAAMLMRPVKPLATEATSALAAQINRLLAS